MIEFDYGQLIDACPHKNSEFSISLGDRGLIIYWEWPQGERRARYAREFSKIELQTTSLSAQDLLDECTKAMSKAY